MHDPVEFLGHGVSTGVNSANKLEHFVPNITLLALLLLHLQDKPYPKTKDACKEEYDYIIVGGGTAGSVMANRLSEKCCVTVLLLECGGEAPVGTEIPGYARLFYGSEIDWNYKTEPQKCSATSQKDRRVIWNAGKCLGGSSVLNAMLYVRGNKKNYDDWAKQGADGWCYDDVKKYFLKLEDNQNCDELDEGYHCVGGPLTAEKPHYNPEIKQPLIDAMEAMGYPLTDINGERQTGIYDIQATIRNQQRCSAAKAYLVPAEDRPNLTIMKKACVTKILFEKNCEGTYVAIGVEFDHNGKKRSVHARREVILSNGAVKAPQLLMLSGIGPREHLEDMGIPCIADLPVGDNLQDHCSAYFPYTMDHRIKHVLAKLVDPANILKYIKKKKGPLTAPDQLCLLAFMDGINTTKCTVDFPRQQLYFAEYTPVDAVNKYNLAHGVYEKVFAKYTLIPSLSCFVSLVQPYSRGTIRLKSLDPHDDPKIDPCYYQDERDVRDAVEGYKICNAIMKRKEMRKLKVKPYDLCFPECQHLKSNLTEYHACQVKAMVITVWHPSGTCRMGRLCDDTTVVGPDLKVKGVDGLRVVCAAIMPIIVSGNPNVPTMMIAEKISDEMKRDIICESEEYDDCCDRRR